MKHKDKITGGKADKKSPQDFNKDALAQGTKHEMEHTKDKEIAQEIAMDHLTEDSEYYVKLKQVEKVEKALDPAAEASARRDKIKNTIRKLKRKKKKLLGQVSITGVSKPQKRAKGEVKETKPEKHEQASKPKTAKKQVMVGKHGGQFILTSGGKKKYAQKIKKSLEDFVSSENKIESFLTKYRSKNGK